MEKRFDVLGTLGKNEFDTTCSILAAKNLSIANYINGFETFESAIEKMLCKQVDCVLVPGAYPLIGNIIMTDRIFVDSVYTYIIPDLVLASNKVVPEYSTLYYHPATESLLQKVNAKYSVKFRVRSNTESCEYVVENNKSVCITNKECAGKFKLNVLQTLRSNINMPFIVFSRKEN